MRSCRVAARSSVHREREQQGRSETGYSSGSVRKEKGQIIKMVNPIDEGVERVVLQQYLFPRFFPFDTLQHVPLAQLLVNKLFNLQTTF